MEHCINNAIWSMKHLKIETKSCIYIFVIRPGMTYTAKTRPDSNTPRRYLKIHWIRHFRRRTGKTFRDRIRIGEIKRTCKTDNINVFLQARKKECNSLISKISEHRIVRIVRDKSPILKSIGRPNKR